MDLKETDILGDAINEHWYYCSKAAATRRLLGDAPITRILDVGAGSGFFSHHLLTQTSAQEIQQMIEALQIGAQQSVATMTESQQHSEESVNIANLAGTRLGSVTQRIGEIDNVNQSVATATEEQTAVVEALNVDIIQINTLNQQGVENLQATLRACSELEQQAGRLNQLVGSFRI